MPIIILEEFDKGRVCNSVVGLENLIYYVLDENATDFDTVRGLYDHHPYSGCEPFPFPKDEEHNPSIVYRLMLRTVGVFHAETDAIAKHRIISFHPADYVLPSDLDHLGRKVACLYRDEGFIAAYGVHRDTYNLHIHIAVCSTSYINGRKLNIWNEKKRLYGLVNSWNRQHLEYLCSNPDIASRYGKLLFGDDHARYGNTALFAKDQIKENRQFRERHKHSYDLK